MGAGGIAVKAGVDRESGLCVTVDGRAIGALVGVGIGNPAGLQPDKAKTKITKDKRCLIDVLSQSVVLIRQIEERFV